MALDVTVGGASADSYASLAEYEAYAAAMGLTLTGDDTSKEANLRRARLYLDRSYVWAGYRVTDTQALQWPRYVEGLVDGYPIPSDAIPQAIKGAQCEMAYLIQGGADPFAAITTGAVQSESVGVDTIRRSKMFASGTERDRAAYPAVDQLVRPYITAKAGQRTGSIPLARA
jgi:hypothetical protein